MQTKQAGRHQRRWDRRWSVAIGRLRHSIGYGFQSQQTTRGLPADLPRHRCRVHQHPPPSLDVPSHPPCRGRDAALHSVRLPGRSVRALHSPHPRRILLPAPVVPGGGRAARHALRPVPSQRGSQIARRARGGGARGGLRAVAAPLHVPVCLPLRNLCPPVRSRPDRQVPRSAQCGNRGVR